MSNPVGECPKCGGSMETGFLLDSQWSISPAKGRVLLWIEGRQIGQGVKIRPGDPGQIEVDALRCTGCGYLELYAGIGD